jgi:putative ubiquitin-RnfH superfamily antitoxin RatB of RatAB toxin-antitoxin module
MAAAEPIGIEVVYALPDRQRVVALQVEAGTSVAEAIRQSGVLAEFPQIDLAQARLGIHSRRVDPQAVLRDGDRIEIYRPLLADPKSARRERARKRQG